MTVSEQIISVINALCEKFGIAIDWTGENVIPYLETLCGKLINYEIGTSIFWMTLCLMLSIVSTVAIKKFYPVLKDGMERQKKTYDIGWTIATVFSIIGLVIVYITTIVVIGVQAMDIIKCAVFPEMYVFEYVQNLISAK